MPNDRAVMGGNNPPSLIDDTLAPFGDTITEAESWADGSPVENEAQMKAVDALIAGIKAAQKAVDDGKEAEYRPHKAAGDEVIARWKPTITDLERLRKCLVAAVDGFKRKLATEKAAKEAALRVEAEAKLLAFQEAHKAANPADIEASRAAERAEREAETARIRAAVAAKDTVKGMRLTWFHEVTDSRALLGWIFVHDREAIDAWAEEYARTHRQDGKTREGMRAWQERVAT